MFLKEIEDFAAMKVVILCGGKGERLREHTDVIPKPLVEIGGKPILWHIMKIYSHYGFSDFILCLGYKGDKIKEYFSKHNEEGWNIECVDTGADTNTGGRIKKIQHLITEEHFMATYGDGVSNVDLKKLLAFHKSHGKIATLTCANFKTNFGILNIDDNNKVKGFNEKPMMNMWINGGFFVFNRKIFDYLEEDSILEKAPMDILSKNNELMAYLHGGFWECMDTYKDTRMLNEAWEMGDAKWKVWKND
jgi:glucose-1-phosphate cytidylyltransferase